MAAFAGLALAVPAHAQVEGLVPTEIEFEERIDPRAQSSTIDDYLLEQRLIADPLIFGWIVDGEKGYPNDDFVLEAVVDFIELIRLAEKDGMNIATLVSDVSFTDLLPKLRAHIVKQEVDPADRAFIAEILLELIRIRLAQPGVDDKVQDLGTAAFLLATLGRTGDLAAMLEQHDVTMSDMIDCCFGDERAAAIAAMLYDEGGTRAMLRAFDGDTTQRGFEFERDLVDFLIAKREMDVAVEQSHTIVERHSIADLPGLVSALNMHTKALLFAGEVEEATEFVERSNQDLVDVKPEQFEAIVAETGTPFWISAMYAAGAVEAGTLPSDALSDLISGYERRDERDSSAAATVLSSLLDAYQSSEGLNLWKAPAEAFPAPTSMLGPGVDEVASAEILARMVDANSRQFLEGLPKLFGSTAIQSRSDFALAVGREGTIRQRELAYTASVELVRGNADHLFKLIEIFDGEPRTTDSGELQCPAEVSVYRHETPDGPIFADFPCAEGPSKFDPYDKYEGRHIGLAQLALLVDGEPEVGAAMVQDEVVDSLNAKVLTIMAPERGQNETSKRFRARTQEAAVLYIENRWRQEVRAGSNVDRSDVFQAFQWGLREGESDALLEASAENAAIDIDPELRELIREFTELRVIEGREIDIPFGGPFCMRPSPRLQDELKDLEVARQHAEEQARYERCEEFMAQERLRKAELERTTPQRQARMREISEIISQRFPEYWDLIDPSPVELATVQASLATDEVLILIVPGYTATSIMAVARDEVRWASSGMTRFDIDRATTRLLWDAGGNVVVPEATARRWLAEGGEGFPFARGLAHKLYNELLLPVEELMEGKTRALFSVGGSLAALPLGVLVTEEPQGSDGSAQDLRETAWLAEKYAIIQMPTISSLQMLTRDRQRSARDVSFAGFGFPDFKGTTALRGGGRRGTALRTVTASDEIKDLPLAEQVQRLPGLPGTKAELERIANDIGSDRVRLVLGEQATEAAVRDFDFRDTSIVSFATHGVMPSDISGLEEAALAFTPVIGSDERNDGLLVSSEIASLSLLVDWVILSACNTAVDSGTDVASLMDSFFFAGARSVIASHWPVADDASAVLISSTIRKWSENPQLTKAEALSEAMRTVRMDASHDGYNLQGEYATWAHPSVWAPFSIYGDADRRQ